MLKKLAVLFVCLLAPLCAQRRVDPRNTHHRLLCVVPIVGKGTAADPFRPEFVPSVQRGKTPPADGIIAFSAIPSDDGKFALVEFVARDASSFQTILSSRRPDVKTFEKGKAKKEDVETEFRKYRKDFQLDKLQVVVP